MKILYSPTHKQHKPKYEIFNGEKTPHQEVPERIENIKKALLANGYSVTKLSKQTPLSLINQVHTSDYLGFFKSFKKKDSNYPSAFPFFHENYGVNLKNKLANHGKHCFDLYTPIFFNTWEIALNSASLAYQLAVDIKEGKIDYGYALCRPPGHHAEKNRMGGYCYLNNTAVAAQYLSLAGKVAVLDVDFHHGNGTQDIFYERADVLTVSIHADPNWKFPYFSGFSNEIGLNQGEGKNINYPMAKGTTNQQYQKNLEKALFKIQLHKPKYLVISLGLDTHIDDPIGGFKLSTDYYKIMAKTIKSLNLPTLIVQEGGYNTNKLGANVVSFLNGFN